MKRFILTSCWGLLLFLTANSQTLNDPIYLNYSFFPSTKIDQQPTKISTGFIELNATAPAINIGKKIKLFNALYYRNSSLSVSESIPHENQIPSTLHDIRYSAILRIQLDKKWELVAIPRIMLRSDLSKGITNNDIFPQVAVLGTYAVKGNPKFKIGLGAAFNNDFERNDIVPLGSLYFESKKIKIEIVYPNANFLYKKSDNLEFGLFTTVDGAISRVSPYSINNETINYLRTFQVLVAPTITQRIYKQVFGHLKIGFAPIRFLEPLNKDFDPVRNQRSEFETNLFARAGVSFRIKN